MEDFYEENLYQLLTAPLNKTNNTEYSLSLLQH